MALVPSSPLPQKKSLKKIFEVLVNKDKVFHAKFFEGDNGHLVSILVCLFTSNKTEVVFFFFF